MCHIDPFLWDETAKVKGNRFRKLTPEQINEEASQLLRQYRKAKGLSMAAAAKQIGMSFQRLGDIERNETRAHITEFNEITAAYGVDPLKALADLLTGDWKRKFAKRAKLLKGSNGEA